MNDVGTLKVNQAVWRAFREDTSIHYGTSSDSPDSGIFFALSLSFGSWCFICSDSGIWVDVIRIPPKSWPFRPGQDLMTFSASLWVKEVLFTSLWSKWQFPQLPRFLRDYTEHPSSRSLYMWTSSVQTLKRNWPFLYNLLEEVSYMLSMHNKAS